MKILVVSDEECPALWDYYMPGKLDEYDMIISCGDLRSEYLRFLVTMGHSRLYYVYGNHDTHYYRSPPDGCDCIDGKLIVVNGVRILGLGGCLRYHPDDIQYTEREMHRRIKKLKPAIKKAGGVDIVVTHTPPKGLGDAEDYAHRGFESFKEILDDYSPKYWLHGHIHLRYDMTRKRVIEYRGTKIINCSERYVLEYL